MQRNKAKIRTHEDIVTDWKKSNAKNTREIDYHSYISERCLEIIKNCENHKGYDNKTKTTWYGLQQDGIDGLEQLSARYKIKLPDWIVGAKAEDLTEKQAREITGYIGALNTMLVDTFTGCKNFSNMDIETRSPFLVYLHNETPYRLRKSYEKGSKGSFLGAVKTNNPYLMMKAMLSKGNGESIGEAYELGVNGGYVRRICISQHALGDKGYTFNEQEERELDIKLKQPNYVAESRLRLQRLSDDYFYNIKQLDAPVDKDVEENKENKQKNKKEQPASSEGSLPDDIDENLFNRLKSAFTAFSEKLFTKNNEEPWQYTGNIDLANRPRVKNKDGSTSTVRSMSYNEDGKEVLIPTVSDEGVIMNDKDAINYWKKKGQNLGVFNSVDEANRAAENIHKDQERRLSENK